jgi:hypothetical protein
VKNEEVFRRYLDEAWKLRLMLESGSLGDTAASYWAVRSRGTAGGVVSVGGVAPPPGAAIG